MIVSPETLALIKAGRKTTITVPAGCYKVGNCYAIQTARSQPAQAHVTLIAIKQQDEASTLRFVLGDHTDQPRLLKARPGGHDGDYTDNPARAMRGEPEACTSDWLNKFAAVARQNKGQDLEQRRQDWAQKIAELRYALANESGINRPRAAKFLRSAESAMLAPSPQPSGLDASLQGLRHAAPLIHENQKRLARS